MRDPILSERLSNLRANKLDLVAFGAALTLGLLLYIALRLSLRVLGVSLLLSQLVVMTAIVAVMIGYAITVARIPRLRVRLDQAGDNAYYLGLLFTLVSMAVALSEFGYTVYDADGVGFRQAGARQIIGNFGIALASTITGIALRVILNQMRVDPADVESMTRIELAEATKRVKASLDSMSIEVGRFHKELSQRTTNVVTSLTEEATAAIHKTTGDLQTAVALTIESSNKAHETVLGNTQALTRAVTEVAEEARAASERLRAVEPPPKKFADRLAAVSDKLEVVAQNANSATSALGDTASAAKSATDAIAVAGHALNESARELASVNKNTTTTLESATTSVNRALVNVGAAIKANGELLTELESRSRKAAVASEHAGNAAVVVVHKLTGVVRGLTDILEKKT